MATCGSHTCPAGQYQHETLHTFPICQLCAAGHYQGSVGQSSCIECAVGQTSAAPQTYSESFEGVWVMPLSSHGGPKWINRSTSTGTPSSSTSPTTAHHGDSYISAEASGAHETSFFMYLPNLNAHTAYFITFWYHMHGDDTGTGLSVGTRPLTESTSWSTIWTVSGQQQLASTDAWRQASISVSPSVSREVRIDALTGTGPASDISIDALTYVSAASGCTDIRCGPGQYKSDSSWCVQSTVLMIHANSSTNQTVSHAGYA
eukprot:COSAG02_NODE_16196_length_1105_cov_1.916501_1_plen_261_part_00